MGEVGVVVARERNEQSGDQADRPARRPLSQRPRKAWQAKTKGADRFRGGGAAPHAIM